MVEELTNILEAATIRISIDGRGRALDNVEECNCELAGEDNQETSSSPILRLDGRAH
jgi:hypothetical protein